MIPTFRDGLGVGPFVRKNKCGCVFEGGILMCDSCGCTPCSTCGAPVEDGVCSICGEKPANCTCEPLDEEFNYEEEEDEDFDDEGEDDEDFDDDEDEDLDDEEEDEDEFEDEDFDDDDGKDW